MEGGYADSWITYLIQVRGLRPRQGHQWRDLIRLKAVLSLLKPTEGQAPGAYHGGRVTQVPALPPSLASFSCRDLGEGTRELAGMARGVDKDPWTTSCPASSPCAQVMVHVADLGRTPPAPWPTAGVSRQHMAYVPG